MLRSRSASVLRQGASVSRHRQKQGTTRQCINRPDLTPRRGIHFLPLLGLFGAKHLTSWTLYNACKSYGWPRVYRRLLEQNRALNRNSILYTPTQQALRMAIEAPPQFAAQFATQYERVLLPLIQNIANQAEPKLPMFLVAVAKYIVNSQKPVKIIQDFIGAAAKTKGPQ